MQAVHVSGPQSGTTRTPVSRVSRAWCRGTHTSDKPYPDLSARANEAALSSQPFPRSLLSFLPQIPQGHLLAPSLQQSPQNSQALGKQSLTHPQRRAAQPGEEEGAPALLWGRGVPRALMPSPATGQGPSLTELAPIRLPNTDMNLPQPPALLLTPPPQAPLAMPGAGLHPNSPRDSARGPQPALAPKALSWHQALRLPAHCPPLAGRSPGSRSPARLAPLTLLRLCTRSWGRGRSLRRGRRR